jgi:hypothetical protein
MTLKHLTLSIALVLSALTVAGSAEAQRAGGVQTQGRSAAPRGVASSALRPAMTVSPNWSGYVATAPVGKSISFKSVTGTWTVPAARCGAGHGATYSTVWVGIGGYTQTRQEEVGTDANCSAAGKPSYYAWFELVPYLSYPTKVSDKVLAGDTITGLVRFLTPKLVELQLKNHTRGWTFTTKINWAINDQSTADWVVEAPAICKEQNCFEASLANFHSATMRDISAVGNGSMGTLADPHWKVIPIRLAPSRLTVPQISSTALSASHRGLKGEAASPAGATPSKPSADGRSFSWTWVKVASRGV